MEDSSARRLSISLPAHLADALEKAAQRRGFRNRSQAIAEMIEQSLADLQDEDPDLIVAGTITLYYDSGRNGLLQKLASIQREHVEECISSQHVLLEGNYVMEVILVQGPVGQLRRITDRLVTCKGVQGGRLTLTTRAIPPLHSR